MNKITSIKIKYADGSYSGQIPIGVLAQNVNYNDEHNLIQVLGNIDVDFDGTIQEQINKKLNSSDLSNYVNNQMTIDVSKWLAANVNPVGSAVIVDQSLSISGAAADSKIIGESFKNIYCGKNEYSSWSWLQGSINKSDGQTWNSSIHCRTSGYFTSEKFLNSAFIQITIKEGFLLVDRDFYSGNSSYSGAYFGEWQSGTVKMPVSTDKKYRFVIKKVSETNLNPSEIPEDVLTIRTDILTDKTLTIQNKIADAKATGDKIIALEEKFNKNEKKYFLFKSDDFAQGTISPTGKQTNAINRCRIKSYFEGEELISDDDNNFYFQTTNLKVGIRVFNEYFTFLGKKFANNDTSWFIGKNNIKLNPRYHYRFIIGRQDDTTINPEDINPENLKFLIKKDGFTDDSLIKRNEAADAHQIGEILTPFTRLSNNTSSILAAKYFTTKDSTIINWYLLIDADNRLYISNDLKNKFSIGKFINAQKYKFGIRNNGDIIAVYRNEFDNQGETWDNSLDNIRKNPYVALNSEKYQVWHQVDFGTNIKPTGWLENCGFCSLPNGDIVFGEYTRMKVLYTSNIWKISKDADITKAENWRIVKTFTVAENDTIQTYDESVIEHIHTLQFDPYTNNIYCATGDKYKRSQIFYSKDYGENWNQQSFIDPDTNLSIISGEKLFRLLNFHFSENYVYWSSDSPEEHVIIKCTRNTNGDGLNPSSINILTTLDSLPGRPATYGTVFYPNYDILILMERCDNDASSMLFRAFDLKENAIKTICTIYPTSDVTSAKIGFRTQYTEFEPSDDLIKCGFGFYDDYRNKNQLCGNGNDTNSNFYHNINNLWIKIYIDNDRNISAKFGFYSI